MELPIYFGLNQELAINNGVLFVAITFGITQKVQPSSARKWVIFMAMLMVGDQKRSIPLIHFGLD